MKLGIKINLNVKKIDKERLIKGEKGTYLDAIVFIDTEKQPEYGSMIKHSLSKEERNNGVQVDTIGNAKVFWMDMQTENKTQVEYKNKQDADEFFEDDVPF